MVAFTHTHTHTHTHIYIFPLLISTKYGPTTHYGVRSSDITKKTSISLSKDSRAEIKTRDLQNTES